MVAPEMKGAFTGGISSPMLKSVGVQWALAGHSERRTINKESDAYINSQCRALISQGMSVMLCIGETESEFEKDLVGNVCEVQLKKGLAGITAEEMSRVVIAYEPVWAIGTGKASNARCTCLCNQAVYRYSAGVSKTFELRAVHLHSCSRAGCDSRNRPKGACYLPKYS